MTKSFKVMIELKVKGGVTHRVGVTPRGSVACLDHTPQEVRRTMLLAEFGYEDVCPCIVRLSQILCFARYSAEWRKGRQQTGSPKTLKTPKPDWERLSLELRNLFCPPIAAARRAWRRGRRTAGEAAGQPPPEKLTDYKNPFELMLVGELRRRGHRVQNDIWNVLNVKFRYSDHPPVCLELVPELRQKESSVWRLSYETTTACGMSGVRRVVSYKFDYRKSDRVSDLRRAADFAEELILAALMENRTWVLKTPY